MRIPLVLLPILLSAASLSAASATDDFPGLGVEVLPPRPPAPEAPPAPPTEEDRARDIRTIESRVVVRDVSPLAVAAATRTIEILLDEAMPNVARGLVQGDVILFIIPKDKKLTDIPEFSGLRGKTTFDGRLWDDVRGVGYYPLPDGRGAGVAVGEENLLGGSNDPPEGYPVLFVLAHEFSHSVQFAGLPAALYDRSLKIYDDSMKRKEGTGLGHYADSNANEDFAQAAAAYFGVAHLDSPKQHGAAARKRLRDGQPEMYALLGQIYGPVRNLDPTTGARSSPFLDF